MGIISVIFLIIGHFFEERKMVITSLILAAAFLFVYLVKGERNMALLWFQVLTGITASLELLRLGAKK